MFDVNQHFDKKKTFFFTVLGPEYVYPTQKFPQDMPYGFFYGLELAAVITITLLGILVNSLLGENSPFRCSIFSSILNIRNSYILNKNSSDCPKNNFIT